MSISLGLIGYPYLANYLFENRTDGTVNTVEKTMDEQPDTKKEQALADAEAYNKQFADGHVQLRDPFVAEENDDTGEYNSLLNLNNNGVMGVIKIPCIDVSLPIYHGTSESVLDKGVGHLEGSSLPIGGESTHSVLTGHTGLSSAKLFTDLTNMEKGDIFFIDVLGKRLAYEVDQIKAVLPSESDDLRVVPGKDYCTLVTCTPYGINSHRLLVRGHRTDYEEAVSNPDVFIAKATESNWMAEYTKAIAIGLCAFLGMMLVIVIIRSVQGSRDRSVDDFY